jgi:hypothetical protein
MISVGYVPSSCAHLFIAECIALLFFNGLEGELEAASGFEPLHKGFAVLGTGVTKSYQILTISRG